MDQNWQFPQTFASNFNTFPLSLETENGPVASVSRFYTTSILYMLEKMNRNIYRNIYRKFYRNIERRITELYPFMSTRFQFNKLARRFTQTIASHACVYLIHTLSTESLSYNASIRPFQLLLLFLPPFAPSWLLKYLCPGGTLHTAPTLRKSMGEGHGTCNSGGNPIRNFHRWIRAHKFNTR